MFQIRLKELRESLSLSQQSFADKIGIRQSTVAMWENGSNFPRKTTLAHIAAFFNVSVDYLMGISDDPGDPKPAADPANDFNDQLRYALFNGENIDLDDAALEEIRAFARFKYEQQKNGRK